MATYTITGHPLNYADLGLGATETDLLRQFLQQFGVGTQITVTLSGPNDLKIKAHKLVV